MPLLPSLEELALRGFFPAAIDSGSYTNILGPLKKLSMRSMNIGTEEDYVAFMEAIKENLEELDIKGQFSNEFFKYIFLNLPKLALLKIDMNAASYDETFYQQLRTNRNIKTLILSDANRNGSVSDDIERRMQGIIGNLPNIDRLQINFRISKELLKFININLRGLRIFQTALVDDNFDHVKFPALQELHILQLHIGSIADWEKFIESFPNIKKLSIDFLHISKKLENIELESVYNFKNVEQISIEDGLISKDFVSYILHNCGKLKCLKVIKSTFFDEVTGDNSIENLFGPDPRLVITSKVDSSMSVDFDLWSSEKDYHLFESDIEDESDADFDDEFSDNMDIDEESDREVYFFYQEEDSDNEFVGAVRPG